MSNEKIRLLLEESLNYSQTDFMDWIELKLERKLNKEECLLIKDHMQKAKILTILSKDAKYLSSEEIVHKISFYAEHNIQVPKLLGLVNEWEKLKKEDSADETKLKELIDKHLN